MTKEELLKKIDFEKSWLYECGIFGSDVDIAFHAIKKSVIEALDQEPKTGWWMPLEYDGYADGYPVYDVWECSECGWEHNGDSDTLTPFCPNCGAKMVEPKESEVNK